jgi:hypothetical protein
LKYLEKSVQVFNPNIIEEVFVMFEDKVLQCRDCGVEFVFSVGEQEFYKEKGFDNQPTRCVECRRLKKQQRNQERYSSYDR